MQGGMARRAFPKLGPRGLHIARLLLEPHRESFRRLTVAHTFSRDYGRIHTAAQAKRDGNIRTEPLANRLAHSLAQGRLLVPGCVYGGLRNLPARHSRLPSLFHSQQLPGFQLLASAKNRQRRGDVSERKVGVDR